MNCGVITCLFECWVTFQVTIHGFALDKRPVRSESRSHMFALWDVFWFHLSVRDLFAPSIILFSDLERSPGVTGESGRAGTGCNKQPEYKKVRMCNGSPVLSLLLEQQL